VIGHKSRARPYRTWRVSVDAIPRPSPRFSSNTPIVSTASSSGFSAIGTRPRTRRRRCSQSPSGRPHAGSEPGPGALITTIAYNVCRDLWRSGAYRLTRQAVSIDDPEHGDTPLTSRVDDPEQALIAAERRGIVQNAIGALHEPLRAVVVLREYQGLSYERIAELTGTTPVAARKRYSRALAELGKLLEKVAV
jgi:RNA polymerase sigma factor (sigma-70 family)